jgi:DNA mismatch repair protein MutL
MESISLPKIRVMDPALVDKIAAGEVVRGPYSILKELVENALDAQSRRVDVELESGGITSLLVKDDGSGIGKVDLPLALQRSASSKIHKAADLFELSSFGFRGEALSAISAVSNTQVFSKIREQNGAKVSLAKNGEILLEDWTSPFGSSGTIVEVKDLFENIPARRKFLRSPRAEFLACKEILLAIAMSRPDVSFSLTHNQKQIFSVEALLGNELVSQSVFGEEVLRRRASELFPSKGDQQWDEFLYLDCRSPYGTFEALLSPPGYEKATSRHMRFYVNGRVVQDKIIRAAVMRGYHSHLLQSRYPQVVIFIKVDPALVDANVHPAKQEVKFQFAKQIQDTLAKEIRGLIRSGG